MKKATHILIYLLMALPILLMQSCLKDDDKVYNDGGNRVEEYLINAKNVLVSSEYGWALVYYPHRQLKVGGFNYAVKFTEGNKAIAWFEDVPNEQQSL